MRSNSKSLFLAVNISIKEHILIGFIIILLIFIQVEVLNLLNGKVIIFGINIILVSLLAYYGFIKDIPTYLLFLTILPFAYIEKAFSRYFIYIVIQNFPLYIFFFLSVVKYFKSEDIFRFRLSPITSSIVLYTAMSFILLIWGIIQGAKTSILIEEFYQNFYFFLAIPITYLLSNRKHYKFLFNLTIIVFLLIAIEYIVINAIEPYRFTTYHNHYFPFIIAILLAIFLYKKRKIVKISALIGMIIIWYGSLSTGTRTLLVANFIATVVVLFFYLKNEKSHWKWIKITSFSILFIFPLLFSGSKKNIQTNEFDTSERVQTISTPLEDISFLMRIETVYLGFNEIIKTPIIGKGFGYQLQMQYLLHTKYTFPDNNYIYYLLKGGIIFLLIALWLFYNFIRESYKLFKQSDINFVKIIMLANIGGMIALMFFGLLNANLSKLKLNILYSLSFAYIDYELRRLNSDNKNKNVE